MLLACGRRCTVLRYSRGLLEGSGGHLRVPRSGSTVLLPGLGLCGRGAETLAMGASTPDLLTTPGLCPSSGMLMAFSLFFCLTAKVKSLLQAQQQPQQPSATASQPSATGKGKVKLATRDFLGLQGVRALSICGLPAPSFHSAPRWHMSQVDNTLFVRPSPCILLQGAHSQKKSHHCSNLGSALVWAVLFFILS